MLGLAAGDAVGTAVEFSAPGSFSPVTEMTGGGPFGLRPGEWTDDTSMALCLAESLVESRGFDARDQTKRYVCWWRDGHLASTGDCFDIGTTVRGALRRFRETGDPLSGSTDPESAANGSIMRLAPVPLAYAGDLERAIDYSAQSSRTTHAAARPVDGCRYLGALIAAAVQGAAKAHLLDDAFWHWGPLDPQIEEIARGSYKRKQPPEIRGSGFVVHTLEAALWALWSTDDFRSGCLAVVNLGEDADTTGAVYGQLAGAIYGVDGIPAEWREQLALREKIESLADGLHELATSGAR
jgi:ADP-ribosylglycohydrolase